VGNIIVGVLFLIGGLTGTLALRGTGSTIALAVLGAILIVVGLIQAPSSSKKSGSKRKSFRRGGRGNRSTQMRRRAG
jgi:hypothetical protein